MITSSIYLEIFDTQENGIVNLALNTETLLEVRQNVVDKLTVGLQGPTKITRAESQSVPSTERYVFSSFDTNHTNTNEFLTGEWVVPLHADLPRFNDAYPDVYWVMDKINFS